MLELILLIISLLCLFSSAEASVVFLLLAVGVLLFKRRSQDDEIAKLRKSFAEFTQGVHRVIAENNGKVEKLTQEVVALRSSGGVTAPAPKMAEKPAPVAPPSPVVVEAPAQVPPPPRKPEPAVVPAAAVSAPPKPEPVAPTPHVAAPSRPEITTPVRETPKPAPPAVAPPPKPVVPVPPSVTAGPILPPRANASYQGAPPRVEMRVPAPPAPPRKPLSEQLKSLFAFEEMLGKNWAAKVGIVLLVLGTAFFGITELGATPAGKVVLLLAGSALLLGGGIYLDRKERYQILGRVGIAGGWAILFFTTYAIHHIEAMRVLPSETVDAVLMLATAVAMAWHTLRYKSQVVTGIAFLLAYSTVAISHDTVYALSAGAALAVGLVIISVRMQWYELEIFGILSSYGNHLYWLYKILGPEGANHHPFPQFYASTIILLVYWTAYRASYIVRKISSKEQESVSSIAAVLNTLLLGGVMRFQSVRPELAFYGLLFLGVLEFGLGQLPITRRRRDAFVLLSILGASLMILAVPFKFTGNNVAILWFVGAEAFLTAGILQKEALFRRIGLITGILVGFHVLLLDCTRLYQERMIRDFPVIAGGILLATCGVLFYLNAHYVFKKWPSLFADRIDRGILSAHSHFGAITVTLAAWALFVLDWTAVAWIVVLALLAWVSRYLRANDLVFQASALGVLTFFRAFTINLHADQMSGTNIVHVSARYLTLPIIAIGFYLVAKWIAWGTESLQASLRHLFAWGGSIVLIALIWAEVGYRWQPLAFLGLALLLTEAAIHFKYAPLSWHVHLLTALGAASAVLYEAPNVHQWLKVDTTTLVVAFTAAAVYWLGKRFGVAAIQFGNIVRDVYTWLGAFVVAWLLWRQLPEPWIAVFWLSFGILLTIVGRRPKLAHLAYQEHVLALASIVALAWYNFPLAASGHFNVRLVTVALCAAGFYGVSRLAAPSNASYRMVAAYLHTFAATALLAVLAWFEAPNPWLAVIWAAFALGLATVGRKFEFEELAWQAHGLAIISAMRALTVNIYTPDRFHGLSLRLVTMVLVIAILYALSRTIELSENLRRRDFHHAYTWVASFLAALLMWYELQPISIAVAWAVFALVLFEIGQLRDIRQIRLQSYAGLLASFIRIFFVNLTAGNTGELLGPRMTTVAPLALIYFFVYSQMKIAEKNDESRWSIDTILAYVGSLTIASLLYFQVSGGWIAAAWAAMVFCLLAASLLLDREVFLHQGLLLSLATLFRGVMHNLFGASYFSDGTWTGRYLELGTAVLAMLAALPIAIKLKNRYLPEPKKGWLRNVLARLSSRPEQVMFFVPTLLLTLMLYLKLPSGMVTVSWGIEGGCIIVLALAVGERSFRLTGWAMLLLCVGKIILVDAWRLGDRDKYLTFIIMGAVFLGAHFLYTRYRDVIKQYL